MFNALLLEKSDAGFSASVRAVDDHQLPEGDVLVQVAHSTLNYKDGLAITNRGPVVRSWPMVAGIDGAGTVIESTHAAWQAGDRVGRQIGGRKRGRHRRPQHHGSHEQTQRAGGGGGPGQHRAQDKGSGPAPSTAETARNIARFRAWAGECHAFAPAVSSSRLH